MFGATHAGGWSWRRRTPAKAICGDCGARFDAARARFGDRVTCPRCGAAFRDEALVVASRRPRSSQAWPWFSERRLTKRQSRRALRRSVQILFVVALAAAVVHWRIDLGELLRAALKNLGVRL